MHVLLQELLARHCPMLCLVRPEVVRLAGIVVESPVEQYLLFVHEAQEGMSSERDRDAMQRSTGAPQAPHPGLMLCKHALIALSPC